MKWNRSQKQLLDIAAEPINGFALDQVKLLEDGPDLSAVIKDICRNPEARAKHVRIHASSLWDVLMTMRRAAGIGYGSGRHDNAFRALTALAGPERRPVVLWLEETRLMKVEQRENLVFLLENVAWAEGIPLRIVMLVGKVAVWVGYEERRDDRSGEMVSTGAWIGRKQRKYRWSPKLNQFATEYLYDGKRIEENTESTPLFEASEHDKVQALKFA